MAEGKHRSVTVFLTPRQAIYLAHAARIYPADIPRIFNVMDAGASNVEEGLAAAGWMREWTPDRKGRRGWKRVA